MRLRQGPNPGAEVPPLQAAVRTIGTLGGIEQWLQLDPPLPTLLS
jgi:hypothetical protein